MEVTILGTSSMVPTKERNPSSIFLSYRDSGLLFDCAEGTQRQMSIAGISRSKVKKILISHWHGDHVAGIVGLLQTIGNKEENPVVEIYGPEGTKDYVKHILKSCCFDVQVDVRVTELKPKKLEKFFENEYFALYCIAMDHSIPCVGYQFAEKDKHNIDTAYLKKNKIKEGPHLEKLKEGKDIVFEGTKIKAKDATYIVPGKKVAYVTDTAFCSNAVKLAKGVDVLFCESTYDASLQDKAEQYKHMTSSDAAKIASQADVKQLVITHFSQRYKDTSKILEEAQTIFPNTRAAFDLMKVNF